jgi:hypothetical protein
MPTLYATFDGQVLLPEEPIPLPPNTRVRLHLEPVGIESTSKHLHGHDEDRRTPSTGLFESTDPRLGEESELFKETEPWQGTLKKS